MEVPEKMLQSNLLQLDLKCKEFYESRFREHFQDRRSDVLQAPKHQTGEGFHYEMIVVGSTEYKRKELRLISIMSWYMDSEVRYHLNLFLHDIYSKLISTCREDELVSLKVEQELLLSSKRNCLGWIKFQEEFNDFDFYGNILSTHHIKRFRSFKIIFKLVSDYLTSQKTYSGWCRGPKDQGSTSSKVNLNKYIDDSLSTRKELEKEIIIETKLRDLLTLIGKESWLS